LKKSLAAVADRANFILNSINYAISNLSQFSESMTKLHKAQQIMFDVLAAVLKARSDIAKDPTGKVVVPEIPGDDLLPLHISASQKDTYFPPIVAMDSTYLKFKEVYKLFYLGDVFDKYPDIKDPTSEILINIQKNFSESLTNGSSFMENYVSTLTALRDKASETEDRVQVVSDLQDLVATYSWTALHRIPTEITSLVNTYGKYYTDIKYDDYFKQILQLLTLIFTGDPATGKSILGGFWADAQTVCDAFTIANSFWTNNTTKLTDILNPNISLWDEQRVKINTFRENIASFTFETKRL